MSRPRGGIDRAGAYQLQAAIAACHARATSWEETDWRLIVAHYGALARVAPSPVIELNCAVAIGLADGPEAGLSALDQLDASALRDYHLLPAARADFLRRLGRWTEAAREYRRALGLADNAREQAFLSARLAACDARAGFLSNLLELTAAKRAGPRPGLGQARPGWLSARRAPPRRARASAPSGSGPHHRARRACARGSRRRASKLGSQTIHSQCR